MTARLVYAIDFGMTTSSLAVQTDDREPQLVTDPASPARSVTAIPTAVCRTRGGWLIGTAAVNARLAAPDGFADEFKRDLGGGRTFVLSGERYTAADLTTEVLRFLRRQATQLIAGEPDVVVLTVPSAWEQDYRQEALRQAAIQAGFAGRTLHIVKEPVAAVVHVRSQWAVPDDQPLLVYDLGGGTFDCAVLTPPEDQRQALVVPGGLADVGGAEFDRKILAALRADGRLPIGGDTHAYALAACESLKRRLSDHGVEVATEQVQGSAATISFTRAELNTLIRPDLERTVQACEQIGLVEDWTALGAVVLVGGSSRIPLIRELLGVKAPGRVVAVPEPELAVVRGAVAEARAIAGEADPIAAPYPPPQAPAKIVGAPTTRAAGTAQLGWGAPLTLLVLWLLGEAARVWLRQQYDVWNLTPPALALLSAAGTLAAYRRRHKQKGQPPSTWVVRVAVLATVYAFLQIVIYVYRALSGGNHAADWTGAAAALGILIIAASTAASISGTRDAVDRVAAEEADAARLAQLTERRWFGLGDQPKNPYHRLLAYSAVRMYELPKNSMTSFHYAISAGNFVLLVCEATDARARPYLSGQLQSWRTQLGDTASVEAFVVLPSGRPPRLSTVDRTRYGYELATPTTFIDLVWTLFADETTVSYPINSVLLRRAARSYERQT
ncbi:Hsp70 family protein [Micromonospora sp. C72]|uniref:Hsp70 family protein n=1 Tax=Micromonospora sp. C72 TaxID=2824880 RepID=UPI001B38172A|nr:Hsp70 family protein [Micromonospora sp. C72]MBQ1041511.1 Hsp70 family protein [Micromonospora sp. C72]